MEGKQEGTFSRLYQIGIVVKNAERAARYYEALGIGPFKPIAEVNQDGIYDRLMYGKPVTGAVNKVLTAPAGGVQVKLVEPLVESFWKEYLDTHGEGVHHLGFIVDDIERETDKALKKGLRIVGSAKFSGGGGYIYLDTAETGGVLMELIQFPSR